MNTGHCSSSSVTCGGGQGEFGGQGELGGLGELRSRSAVALRLQAASQHTWDVLRVHRLQQLLNTHVPGCALALHQCICAFGVFFDGLGFFFISGRRQRVEEDKEIRGRKRRDERESAGRSERQRGEEKV